MSFRGKPSRGCSKCRQRKVKCDETRPTCKRCIKGGFDCQYRDSFDLFFRNQTTQVAHKAQEKWRSRAKRPSDLDATSSESNNSDSSTSESASRASPLPPTLSMLPFRSVHARQRFFYDYWNPFDPLLSRQAPFLGFISRCSQQSPEHRCLNHSLAAAAYANFAGRYHSKEDSFVALQNYGEALKLLTVEMAGPSVSNILENLVSICFLGMYELISTPEMSERGSWIAHTNGASALLQQAAKNIKTPDPAIAGIYHWIFSQMLISSLSQNKRPTLPLELRDMFLCRGHYSYELTGLMYNTACVCADWKATLKELRSGRQVDINEIQSFISRGENLDSEFEKWSENLPEEFDYEKFPTTRTSSRSWLNPLLTASGAPEVGHRYKNYAAAARWTFWRTARLILNGNILEMCRTMSDAPPLGLDVGTPINIHRRRKLFSRMLDLANNICEASISHFTVAIDAHPDADTSIDVPSMRGYLLLWPLFMAGVFYKWASVHALDIENRRDWVRAAVCFIQKQLSIQKAAAFVHVLEFEKAPDNGAKEQSYPSKAESLGAEAKRYITQGLLGSPYPEIEFSEHTFTSNAVIST